MSLRPPFATVATVNEIPEGAVKHIVVHDKPMVLARVEGQFYAVNAVCPHRGGPLAEGMVDGNVVVCPWHGWRFDCTTGTSPVIPTAKVDKFEVVVEGNDVKVKL